MKCCDDKFAAAKMNHRIVFQSLSLTATTTGGQTESWSDFKTVWASIETKQTDERNFAGRIEPMTTHIIRCRYLPGVTSTMRVKFGDRYFEIKSVINIDEENEFLQIKAMERTGT